MCRIIPVQNDSYHHFVCVFHSAFNSKTPSESSKKYKKKCGGTTWYETIKFLLLIEKKKKNMIQNINAI